VGYGAANDGGGDGARAIDVGLMVMRILAEVALMREKAWRGLKRRRSLGVYGAGVDCSRGSGRGLWASAATVDRIDGRLGSVDLRRRCAAAVETSMAAESSGSAWVVRSWLGSWQGGAGKGEGDHGGLGSYLRMSAVVRCSLACGFCDLQVGAER
jgi:hypothetical protein